MNNVLPTIPDTTETLALHRIARSAEGQKLAAYLGRAAQAYMEATLAESDTKSRQNQGAWLALTSLINTLDAAAKQPG